MKVKKMMMVLFIICFTLSGNTLCFAKTNDHGVNVSTSFGEYIGTVKDRYSARKFLSKEFDQKTTDMILDNLSIDEIEFIEGIELIKKQNKGKSADEIADSINWDSFSSTTSVAVRAMSSGSLYEEFNKLTPTEKKLVVLYPKEALIVKSCAKVADEWTSKYFPKWKDGDKGNAYRHAYWNASMKITFNSGTNAKMWADAHEAWPDSVLKGQSWNGFTAYQHRAMDYHNNEKGRDCIKWYELFVSETTIHNRIITKINNKEMSILVK